MSTAQLKDALPSVIIVVFLSPVAVACFRCGIPIELIVFSLLVAGYKGPRIAADYIRKRKSQGAKNGSAGHSPELPQDDPPETVAETQVQGAGGLARPWRRSTRKEGEQKKCPAGGAEQRPDAETEAPARPEPKRTASDGTAKAEPKRTASDGTAKAEPKRGPLLKQKTPQLQWRSIINKFTPEKFDKLCEQLMATLPNCNTGTVIADSEFQQVLEDLLSLIFEASSRQHQYTEMYTDLCQKIVDFVAGQRPDFDSKSRVWMKCQTIFKTMILTAPEIPADLASDEYADRKAKHKEKMVGIVKFGGDLVSRRLVPCDGVMQWIQTLLSEKTQELYCAGDDSEDEREAQPQDKDIEQREVQLELLCAILACMGSSMDDQQTMSQENRLVIEDVFNQLEQLSMDTKNLSLRIRCLIRDVLDLRLAQWKEKEGKLKPGMLQRPEASDLRESAPEFIPSFKGCWSSDRLSWDNKWFDPELLKALQQVEHHLEIVDDRKAKLRKLCKLVNVCHLMQELQIVVVAKNSNVHRVVDAIAESFEEVSVCVLLTGQPDEVRIQNLKDYETGDVAVVVMADEVFIRQQFELCRPCQVLVHFDFPITIHVYTYRLHKRADSNTRVHTFFSTLTDMRHTTMLVTALESAGQKVPDALRKLKDHVSSEGAAPGGKGGRDQGRRNNHNGRGSARKGGSKCDDGDDHREHREHRDVHRDRDHHRGEREASFREKDSSFDRGADMRDRGSERRSHPRSETMHSARSSGRGQMTSRRTSAASSANAEENDAPWFQELHPESSKRWNHRGDETTECQQSGPAATATQASQPPSLSDRGNLRMRKQTEVPCAESGRHNAGISGPRHRNTSGQGHR